MVEVRRAEAADDAVIDHRPAREAQVHSRQSLVPACPASYHEQ